MSKEPKVEDPSGTIDPSSAGSTNSGPSGDADKPFHIPLIRSL